MDVVHARICIFIIFTNGRFSTFPKLRVLSDSVLTLTVQKLLHFFVRKT